MGHSDKSTDAAWLRETRMGENMSDVIATDQPSEANAVQPEAEKETDWKAEARKWESRAKDSLASAKANEDAAKRLTEIEEANKTESQRVTERAEAAEKRVLELESRTIRAEVSAAKGIPVELLSGSTQEELEKSADALIAFRGEQVAARLTAPREGISPTKQVSDSTEFVKSLFGRGD